MGQWTVFWLRGGGGCCHYDLYLQQVRNGSILPSLPSLYRTGSSYPFPEAPFL